MKTSRSDNNSTIVKAGKLINLLGKLCLPLAAGLALGFYAADQGMRWLPTMLEILLFILVAGFVAIPLGRILQGKLYEDSARKKRLRKRVLFFIGLACLALIARLVLHSVKEPRPLTELSTTEFNLAFEMDAQRYLELDSGLESALNFLTRQKDMFDPQSDQVLNPDQEKLLLDSWYTIYNNGFALDQIRVFYEDWYRFDPSRAERSYLLRSYLLTYAAELTLYEKSVRITKLIKQNENAQKFLDTPHPSHNLPANTFSFFRQELQSAADQARVIAGEQYLKWLGSELNGIEEARSLGVTWLWNRADKHLLTIDAINGLDKAELTVRSDLQVIKRAIRRNWYPAQTAVATWMGDTRLKRVGTYLITPELLTEMDQHIQPGDIFLSRKNWYLSNVGLPGFWPHAILYIGDPAKFGAYFNDADVVNYIEAISGRRQSLGDYLGSIHPDKWQKYQHGSHDQPYVVIEALSEGVIFNTYARTAGDYLAALRPNLSRLAKAQAVIEAFSHLNKPYDYEFDFATDHALVCTELVWRSYRPAEGKDGLLLFPEDVMGRQTLPANSIAQQFAQEYDNPEAQMEFVYFIDARENNQRAFASTLEEFLKTYQRNKWDIFLE